MGVSDDSHQSSIPAIMLGKKITISLILFSILTVTINGLPQNYDDIDMSIDQPKNEKVDISQDSPQSNAIHIGNNNSVGSEIKIKQTKPYNTSVHISLNVGSDSRVL